MTRSTKRDAVHNSGIQANTVSGDVIGVGEGASATKIVKSETIDKEMPALVAELRSALNRLSLEASAKQAIDLDVAKLEKAATERKPDPRRISSTLGSIAGTLKTIGVIASQVVGIAEPVKKIVSLFGLSLPW